MATEKLPFEVIAEASLNEMKTLGNSDKITTGTSKNNKNVFQCGSISGAISEGAMKILTNEKATDEDIAQLSFCKLRFIEDNKELWVMRTSGIAKVVRTL